MELIAFEEKSNFRINILNNKISQSEADVQLKADGFMDGLGAERCAALATVVAINDSATLTRGHLIKGDYTAVGRALAHIKRCFYVGSCNARNQHVLKQQQAHL
jgi:hypothetical protein